MAYDKNRGKLRVNALTVIILAVILLDGKTYAAISSSTCNALGGTKISNGNCVWLDNTSGAGSSAFINCNTEAATQNLGGKFQA